MTALQITDALPYEADALSNIALCSKALWNYSPQWLEVWRDELRVTESYIRGNPVRVARIYDCPIGFCGLTVSGSRAEIDHLWIRPEWTRRGVGAALIDRCMADLATVTVSEVRVVSDPHAEGFYRRMGFVPAGTFRYELLGYERELPILVKKL